MSCVEVVCVKCGLSYLPNFKEPWPQSCVCGGESFVAYFDEEGDHE